MRKKNIIQLIKGLVTAITLLLLVRMVNIQHLKENIVLVPWWFYLLAVLLTVFRTWLLSVRWRLLNSDVSGQISNWQYFRFSMIAKLYDLIMPGALGGDIVKGGYVWNHVKVKRGENIISLLVDRFVGFTSIIVLGSISLLMISDRIQLNKSFVIVILLSSLAIFYLLAVNNFFLSYFSKVKETNRFLRSFRKAIEIMLSCIAYYKKHKLKLFVAFLIALPIHMITFILVYFKAILLNIDIAFVNIVFVLSVTWIISSIPVSVGGHGVRELSQVYLFGLFGVLADDVIAILAIGYIQKLLFSLFTLLFLFDFGKVVVAKSSGSIIKSIHHDNDVNNGSA